MAKHRLFDAKRQLKGPEHRMYGTVVLSYVDHDDGPHPCTPFLAQHFWVNLVSPYGGEPFTGIPVAWFGRRNGT